MTRYFFRIEQSVHISIGVSAIFFIPAMVWMRKCLFPTPFEKEQNNSIRLHIKRHKKMKKKKRFIAQGKDEEYRLDDEYVPDQHVYAPKEEYLPKSIARGISYKDDRVMFIAMIIPVYI